MARNYTEGDDWQQRRDLRVDGFADLRADGVADLRADGVAHLLVVSLSFDIIFRLGFYLYFFVWNGPESEGLVWATINFWCSFRQIYVFVFLFVHL